MKSRFLVCLSFTASVFGCGGSPSTSIAKTSNNVSSASATPSCGEGTGGPEVCDGIDNDCDGYIDNVPGTADRLTVNCSSACGPGIQWCDVAGNSPPGTPHWSQCTAPQPTQEVCDGIDNDCDGYIDNVPGTTNALTMSCTDASGDGTQACNATTGSGVASWNQCVVQQQNGNCVPTTEICDGIDNDCNGLIDDGADQACMSPCGAGILHCINGVLETTCAPTNPPPEICDGIDNNCNGLIDEGCP